jgi:hypothetical protein
MLNFIYNMAIPVVATSLGSDDQGGVWIEAQDQAHQAHYHCKQIKSIQKIKKKTLYC